MVGFQRANPQGIAIAYVGDGGAYASLSNHVMLRSTTHAAGPYEVPNVQVDTFAMYTNNVPSGAFRGYGVPQGYWPVERHMEKIARALGLDPIEFRLKNAIHPGEYHPFSTAWNEGREPRPEVVHTVGLEQCVAQGKAAIGWDDKYKNEDWHSFHLSSFGGQERGKRKDSKLRKGIGVAMVMQGTAIPYLDMGGASIKMNDDGSFNLLVGATDLGTGSDTVLAQMAAEVLGVPVEDMITYSSDTDFTPFDKGAYASSTTYISGTAATNAAKIVAERIKIRAADVEPEHRAAFARVQAGVTLAQAVEDAERRTISATMVRCGNDLGQVARELGVSGTTLWRKMKRLGLGGHDQGTA